MHRAPPIPLAAICIYTSMYLKGSAHSSDLRYSVSTLWFSGSANVDLVPPGLSRCRWCVRSCYGVWGQPVTTVSLLGSFSFDMMVLWSANLDHAATGISQCRWYGVWGKPMPSLRSLGSCSVDVGFFGVSHCQLYDL